MAKYTVRTDAFLCDNIEADSLDEAIEIAFRGQHPTVADLDGLELAIGDTVEDGGWCWIERDGERLVEIGSPR